MFVVKGGLEGGVVVQDVGKGKGGVVGEGGGGICSCGRLREMGGGFGCGLWLKKGGAIVYVDSFTMEVQFHVVCVVVKGGSNMI